MCTWQDDTCTCRAVFLSELSDCDHLCLYRRSDSNLSSHCGQKPQTRGSTSASLSAGKRDPDSDSLCSSREGTSNIDTANGSNLFADTHLNIGKNVSKKSKNHDNCKGKSLNSEQGIDKEQCPTRANLPQSEDVSIDSASSKENQSLSQQSTSRTKLADPGGASEATDKPASPISEDQLHVGNIIRTHM